MLQQKRKEETTVEVQHQYFGKMIRETALHRKHCSRATNGGELVIIYTNEEGKEASDRPPLAPAPFHV